jgi:hypothetical protein
VKEERKERGSESEQGVKGERQHSERRAEKEI